MLKKKTKIKTIFKDCFKIVWKNPLFWVLGFFSAFLVNNEINLVVVNFKRINSWVNQLIVLNSFQIDIFSLINKIPEAFYNNPRFILAAFFGLFLVYLAFHSKTILIYFLKRRKKSLKENWKKTRRYLFPVFIVYLISFLIPYFFLLSLNIPFIKNLPIPIIVYIIIFLILILFVSFVSRFTIISLILEKNNIIKAIKSGFLFFIKNILPIFKVLIYISLITLLIGLVLFSVLTLITILTISLFNLLLKNNVLIGISALGDIYLVILFLSVVFVSSVFSAWQTFVWVTFFQKIKKS